MSFQGVSMLVACWSAKGGVGTTVVSAALAVVLAGSHPAGCLLIDASGDVPGALGLPEPDSPGLAGWSATPAGHHDDEVGALRRLEVPVAEGLRLITRGTGALGPTTRVEALVALLAADERAVVVDAGVITEVADALPLAACADRSLLVTRACYLALRRATRAPLRPSGVVVVAEPGRVLGSRDIEAVVGVPVVAEIPFDPAVARAVDAGMLATRLPRALARALAEAA